MTPRLEESGALRAALIERLRAVPSPAAHERVFVNRALRMENIRRIGFDLDWTLADYRRLPLEKLVFALTQQRLVEHHGYPEVLRQMEFRPDFPCRGLLIDKEAGTVLRMSRHRFVNLAYFGRQRLNRAALKRLYRYEPIQPASDRFYHIDSLFELPETNIFSELVEISKSHPELGRLSYTQLFADVRSAIDWVHAQQALKSRVEADTSRFLVRDPVLALSLLRLRLGGRRMILLTNSEWTYANHVCSYLFDGILPGLDSWRDLFDLVVVSAGKPAFFREERPFVRLDEDGRDSGVAASPNWGGIYRRGNLGGLMQLLDVPGEQVLYVGDHIYGDAVTSKRESTWRIGLIVRELEEELQAAIPDTRASADHVRLLRRLSELGHRMDHLRDLATLHQLGENPGPDGETWRQRFEQARAEHGNLTEEIAASTEAIDRSYNPYWGSLFKQGTSKSRFADQIESYACLYTARARNFVAYGSQHYFRVARDPMMHELEDLEPSPRAVRSEPEAD